MKKNYEKEIERENDNEDIVTGNLILNKTKYIENKEINKLNEKLKKDNADKNKLINELNEKFKKGIEDKNKEINKLIIRIECPGNYDSIKHYLNYSGEYTIITIKGNKKKDI